MLGEEFVMCKISLIVPVYQMEKYIMQFLKSIEKQKLREIEVILVDDGSTDASPNILDEFTSKDERFKVIHQTNSGVCAARNTALSCAKGEYVYIVDSDDWLADDALERLWTEAVHTNADVIYGQTICERLGRAFLEKPFPRAFCTDNKETIKQIQCALMNNNYIYVQCPEFDTIYYLGGAPWRAMLRRNLLVEHEIKYDLSLKSLGEDIIFWQQVYEYVNRVAYIEVPIYHYRMLQDSLSHGYKENLFEIYKKVFDKEEQFLYEYKKDKDYWIAYYARVITYINQSMEQYFLNNCNPKSKKERYKEFKNIIKEHPFCSSIKFIPMSMFVEYKKKLIILLLKRRMYRLLWILKAIFEK